MTDTSVHELTIDFEFQSLIPPLSDDEFKLLEKSVLTEGVRDPIITWDGVIIDGHNRYTICQKHGIRFKTASREFSSRDAAKIWIIENQFGRRNLSKYDRSVLALQLEPLYAAEAKRIHDANGGDHGNQHTGGKVAASQKSDAPPKVRTDEQLAKLAGTSRDTIRKVKVIETEAAKGNQTAIDARDAIKSGKKSLHKAYQEVRPKGNKKDPRPLCTICGKPIDEGDSYAHDQLKHKTCASKNTEEYRGTKGGRPGKNTRNADYDLLNNKPVYTIDSMLDGLTSSVNDLRDAWALRIEINESVGVRLTDEQKDRLNDAVSDMLYIIDSIRKEQKNG